MKLFNIIILVATVIHAVGAFQAQHPQLNGWYPCADNTFSDAGSSDSVSAECATYVAPLCYPGICKTPQFATPHVNIFVKRMLATKGDAKTATNVWLLQGGPGDGSSGLEGSMIVLHNELKGAANIYTMDHRGTGRSTFLDCVAAQYPLEGSMIALHTELKGAANIYTMDHRGTGRSTFLDCVAAQATTTGSPDGNSIKPSEVPACAQALENEYGDLASFSVTSAATDVVTFISKFTNGANTIVYGVSYGTVLVERIMHLNPLEVTGYVLDGVATSSGSSVAKFQYMSRFDVDFGEVGDYFLSLCTKDPSCSAHFKRPNTLQKTLQNVLKSFDKHPNSSCATVMSKFDMGFTILEGTHLSKPTPSMGLRYMLGRLLMNEGLRKFIPLVVYRLSRCDKNDIKALTQFVTAISQIDSTADQEEAFTSLLLYYLIIFSEMWETPQPSMSVMESRFNRNLRHVINWVTVTMLHMA
ncbi:hypothetical protein PHMEG_00036824 [Phytophthora megakarya]|uniref:Serine protease n=1 Tax=Phytophthora megakarya TaxID=4795 RepID=A0A225UL98_9STRA|nr:hypothetical protein PHMEG_00036824 [Phytophthora megakarya]